MEDFKMPSTGKIIGWSALFLIGIFVLTIIGSAMNLITIPWLKFNRQVQMNRDIVTKTYNADNALYNYHWFQERLQAIKATEVQIDNAKAAQTQFKSDAGPRKDWTFEDKTEDARLGAVVLGLKNHYQTIVAEYNARANEADRAIFSQELPLFFSLKAY